MSQGGSTNLTECYDERDKCNVINQLASQGHIIQAIGYSNESMICDIYSITHDCDPSLSSFVIVSVWQSQIQNIKDLGLKFCLVKGMQYCWSTLSMSEFAGANCNGVWGSDSLSCPDWPATTPLPPPPPPPPSRDISPDTTTRAGIYLTRHSPDHQRSQALNDTLTRS